MSMSLAMKVGLGVGAATALGGFVAILGTHLMTGKQWAVGSGAGLLFGGLAGNVAAQMGTMVVDGIASRRVVDSPNVPVAVQRLLGTVR